MTTAVGYEGEPLTLADGRTVRLRYGMRSLMRIEERFGSLAALQSAISTDGTGAIYKPGLSFIACGLLHERGSDRGPLSDPEVLADLIDPYQDPEAFQVAVTAAGKALAAAFPAAAQDAAAADGATPDSPGTTGTTSVPSPSAAPTTSSG